MPAHRVDITLPATPEAARSARRALSEAVTGSDLADDARLLVTETVSNAVRHTVSTRIRMVVTVEPGTDRLLCALRDDTPPPRPREPGRRGLREARVRAGARADRRPQPVLGRRHGRGRQVGLVPARRLREPRLRVAARS
ncbi:ATP-binding protein [Streptomyces sp. NPDC090741]|uniref:ATP-binding protein n=1 Tax=Streptomyces sp. NPDC090741 TaxID=3365967 RepID=UPI003830478F